MSHWSNTTFIRLPHPKAAEGIFNTLRSIFAVDGYHLLEGKPQISKEESRLMQYGKARDVPIWGVAFIPGKGDWHVIKTAPFPLLVYQPGKMLMPRLTRITEELRCHALYVDISDSVCLLTLEADGSSNCLMSGGTIEELNFECDDLSDYQMEKKNIKKDMEILSYSAKPFLLRPDFNAQLKPRSEGELNDVRWATDLTGLDDEEWDNTIQVEYLIPGKRIPIAGAKSWYFRRG